MRTDPNLHYLDNAATTMVDPAVADAIAAALRESWANPSSLYDPAVLAEHKLNAARAKIAKTLNCAAGRSTLPPAAARATTGHPGRGAAAAGLGEQNRHHRL